MLGDATLQSVRCKVRLAKGCAGESDAVSGCPSLVFLQDAELSVSGGCFEKVGPPGGPFFGTLWQWKNSDAKVAIFVSLLSTGLGRQSGVPKGAKFAGFFFDHRAVLASGPEQSPKGEIREAAAVGQHERSSDRFAATPETRLLFCVIFETGAGYASRLAAMERKSP